jgi:probable HAF family extracellular repeat protein
LWTGAGILDLGTLPGGTFSYATAINNLDEVIGYGDNSVAHYEGYIWNKATGMQDIGSLDGSGSIPMAVNDLNQVVGYASLISIANQAFVWSRDQGMKDLNNLIDPSSGWVLTNASGINASGQITGVGTFNQLVHSYLLTPNN